MNQSIIQTRGLTKRFGKNVVLGGVDLDIAPGTVTALLGRNGVGKSTLLKILVGFHVPDAGMSRVMGHDPVKKGPEIRKHVGYVPERLELPTWMTVEDHFRFLKPFYPTWNPAEVARLCEKLGLDLKAKINTLSKGFRTKHALASALAFQPEVLLLDEPFSGLDPVVRGEVMTTVLAHLKDEGRTVVLVSHSISDVERVADTVVFLEEGRVRRIGDLEDVQRTFVRLAVTLANAETDWTPPGEPQVERKGDDVLLTYTDWNDFYEEALDVDDSVASVRRLGRDLNDVFLATVGTGE
jgi:ABC-2 type transport system ATP-binding protein